jgi:hypothetical protein
MSKGGGMDDELDLYAGPGIPWRKVIAFGVALVLMATVVGYRWMTVVTPVSRERALSLFHEEQGRERAPAEPRRAQRNRADRPLAPTSRIRARARAATSPIDRLRGLR